MSTSKAKIAAEVLAGIRDGRRVKVAFVQGGVTVCILSGRLGQPPKDDPLRNHCWVVGSNSGTQMAFILAQDRVLWFAKNSQIRVDLRGRRFPPQPAPWRKRRRS